jgi:hypothetical protein
LGILSTRTSRRYQFQLKALNFVGFSAIYNNHDKYAQNASFLISSLEPCEVCHRHMPFPTKSRTPPMSSSAFRHPNNPLPPKRHEKKGRSPSKARASGSPSTEASLDSPCFELRDEKKKFLHVTSTCIKIKTPTVWLGFRLQTCKCSSKRASLMRQRRAPKYQIANVNVLSLMQPSLANVPFPPMLVVMPSYVILK